MKAGLSELIDETKSISEKIEQTFGGLTEVQLNWKPNEKCWSIVQCLEHLMITNQLEFPAIDNSLKTDYKNPWWSKVPFLPKISGKIGIYLFKPQNRRKFKAPKSFQPSTSKLDKKVVRDSLDHQQALVSRMEQCQDLDIRKTKIVSPISNIITYSLADAFQILVVHELRHFEQATRILETEGFPD